jgi:hypothetical protein
MNRSQSILCSYFIIIALLLVHTVSAVDNPMNYDVSNLNTYYTYKPSRVSELNTALKPYMKITSIGTTKLTNKLYKYEYNTADSQVIYIARQHGDEPAGSFMSEGFFFGSIGRAYHVQAIPMVNPDGASRYTRVDAYGLDSNRNWNTGKCYETNAVIKGLNLSHVKAAVDNHALNSGETYSYITISSQSDVKAACALSKQYLPDFKCQTTTCPGSDIARGYFCKKGVKYSILIEISQASTTPAYAEKQGEQLAKLLEVLP